MLNIIKNVIFLINQKYCKKSGLYIQVDENNKWLTFPHGEINVWQLHPYHIFLFGPPKGWMEFVRVPPPKIGVYQYFDPNIGAGPISSAFSHNGVEYGIVDGKYTDIWHVKDMTKEEILKKQNQVKKQWKEEEKLDIPFGFPSWIFNEKTCGFTPPYPCPGLEDGSIYDYDWNEETLTWDRIFEDLEWTGIKGSSRFYRKVTKEMEENNCNKIILDTNVIIGYENTTTGERVKISKELEEVQVKYVEPDPLLPYGE